MRYFGGLGRARLVVGLLMAGGRGGCYAGLTLLVAAGPSVVEDELSGYAILSALTGGIVGAMVAGVIIWRLSEPGE